MEAIGIAAVIGITVTAAWLIYMFKRRSVFMKLKVPTMAKSPSTESLSTLVQTEDPTQVAS